MSAGVLLRYAGGSVYALPRHVVGLVWDLAVAGAVLRCRMDASTIPDGAWLRVTADLATLAALPALQRRVDVMTAARSAAEALQRAAVAAAEHMRGGAKAMADVAAAVRPKAKRPTKAKRTGNGRAKR